MQNLILDFFLCKCENSDIIPGVFCFGTANKKLNGCKGSLCSAKKVFMLLTLIWKDHIYELCKRNLVFCIKNYGHF